MDRLWIQRTDNSNRRIQAIVTDILLDSIIHITVETELTFNESYTILLDDGRFQTERYALFIMDALNLIDLMFPKTPPEFSAAMSAAQCQRFDELISLYSTNFTVIFYLQFKLF